MAVFVSLGVHKRSVTQHEGFRKLRVRHRPSHLAEFSKFFLELPASSQSASQHIAFENNMEKLTKEGGEYSREGPLSLLGGYNSYESTCRALEGFSKSLTNSPMDTASASGDRAIFDRAKTTQRIH